MRGLTPAGRDAKSTFLPEGHSSDAKLEMTIAQILTRSNFPLFGAIYAVAGIAGLLRWVFESENKVLLALSGLILVVGGINGYVEQWPNLRYVQFHDAALVLVGSFLLFYSILCIRLMEQAGIAKGRAALVSAFLPVVYLLAIGLLVSLSQLSTEDNPAVIIYVFLIFTCAVHIPAFAFGKSRTMKLKGGFEPLDSRITKSLLQEAVVLLGAPLLIALLSQEAVRGAWMLFSLNVSMTIEILSLFLISLGYGSALYKLF